MAIHCMLLTEDNRRIVENFVSEFKDKYDCMQNLTMVKSMISAWQSANFKDGEEPTMPTKDEIEQFIQSQLGKEKQSPVASVNSTNIADYVNTEGEDKGFLTKKGEKLLSTTFDKSKFNNGTFSVALYPGPSGTTLMIGFISPKGNKFYAEYSSSPTRKTWYLLNSEQQNITNVTSEKYWNIINTIVPKSLRDLIDSGEYYKMDTTDTEKGGVASFIKRSELEDYFEKEYNVFMQGRSLDYNTKQINKALSPVQEHSNEKQSIIDKAKKNGTFMKAPNGKPTNLTEKQWVQVRTKAFKDWFGDWENDPKNASKVVDENGEPLVVYHNSNADINIFDKNKIGTNGSSEGGLFGEGFYFSTNKDYNSIFGNKEYAVFLNIKNPITDERTIKEIQAFKPSIDIIKDAYNKDGLIGINKSENNTIEYVAYDSNQIKSALNNTGAFSKDSNDIYDTDSKETLVQNTTEKQDTTSTQEETSVQEYKPINSNNVFKHSLFRGQAPIPEIDKDGNLHLKTSYDSLSKLKTLSFASKKEEALHYGYRVAKNPYIIELNEDYLDTILPNEEYKRDKVENKKPFRYNEESNEVRLSFNDEIIIPKGQNSIRHF